MTNGLAYFVTISKIKVNVKVEMRHMTNNRTLPSNNYFKFLRIVYQVKVLPRMRIRSFKYLIKIKIIYPKTPFLSISNRRKLTRTCHRHGGWSPRLNKSSPNNLFFRSNDPVPGKSNSNGGVYFN